MKAGNKKKQAVVLRNVLASPYEKFWPLLNSNDSDVLGTLLLKVLPSVAILKGVLPQKKLKQIYREKDPSKRKCLWKQKENSNQQSKIQVEKAKLYRKSLLMGVNSVARGLEKSNVVACLISGDVTQRMLVEHIIESAARSGVTVLVVPSLKKITQTALAFPCLSMALHKCVAEDKNNLFFELYELILKLGKNFNVPDHLSVLKNRVIESNNAEGDSTEPDIPPINIIETKSSCQSTFHYLHRPSSNQRAFIPPKPDTKVDSDYLAFIPISVQDEAKSEIKFNMDKYDGESDKSDISDTDMSNDSKILKPQFSESAKRVQKSNKINSKENKTKGKKRLINFKPAAIKRIKSNPNKKRRKL